MSTSDIELALRRAARLRARAEGMEREDRSRKSLPRRVWSFVIGALTWLLVIVLALDAWLAYRTFHTDSPASGDGSSYVDRNQQPRVGN